ncbi:MAG: SIR2 family protein [bacterium]|nr:SIR2 family protein [bacterium]
MERDPLVALASSIHAGPRTFALLLGSGISTGAGVPSGWDVVLDLVKRYAVLQDDDAGEDPVSWYRSHTAGDPNYSELLAELAPSQVDRRNLLKPYFEPTEEDRANGLKVPTPAHHAIAQLVSKGYVKVIVTTNFDRLLETALGEAGVEPNVVSTSAHAEGSLPITHSDCTIIKVHGDYISPDLKNTIEELSQYDPAVDRLLDEVFDQYGLIVCGWSGVWDSALRNAILRAPGRRFTTYWFHRGPINEAAREIIRHRDAKEVSIQDADTVFEDLAAKVEALESLTDQRPFETELAVAQLKLFLPDPIHRIKLHDLIIGEADHVINRVQESAVDTLQGFEHYAEQMAAYEEATARLLRLLAVGACFSDCLEHDELWQRCVDRLASRHLKRNGNVALLNLQQYPTLLAIYATGLGSVATGRLESIAHVLAKVKVRDERPPRPVAVAASSWDVLDRDIVKQAIPKLNRHPTPISEHLFEVLRPIVSDLVPSEEVYADCFDEVEYLLGISYAVGLDTDYGPIGRAVWRSFRRHKPTTPPPLFSLWPDNSDDDFPGITVREHHSALTESGLFTNINQLVTTIPQYDKFILSNRHHRVQ